jgi:para-nitrobenzyl esterase
MVRKVMTALFCAGLALCGLQAEVKASPSAIVATEAGKLQGFVQNGMYIYRGIQYAKAARFMPPEKVDKWEGVKLAISYGNNSWLELPTSTSNDEMFNPHRYWPMSDNCQFLNVWTPGISQGKKRPVMVWIHGGGFSNGSAIEGQAYDGENLSKKGDVVVVSLNHRLNAIGFLDLSAYGDKYKYSGNVGIMDIVAALQWVKANIANFGGDPDNVTLFGQSGGGGKILTLLAAPSAKGLFRRVIAESPSSSLNVFDKSVHQRIAAATLQNLGLKGDQIDQLQSMPYSQLIAAANKAYTQINAEDKTDLYRWAPETDGDFIPNTPLPTGSGFADFAKDIPMIIGDVLDEQNTTGSVDIKTLYADNKNSWTGDYAKAMLAKRFGDKADAVGAAFLKAYPDKKLADAYFVDSKFRPLVIKTAELKAAQGGAPVYNYMFTRESPVLDGAAGVWHCSELPYVFYNAQLCDTATGGDKAAVALSEKMSQAWINFARTGNPNAKGLPTWPAFTADKRAIMIFSDSCEVRYNHDGDLMSLISPYAK